MSKRETIDGKFKCSKCKEFKFPNRFSKRKNGFKSQCKACVSKLNAIYREQHNEQLKEKRIQNQDKVKKYQIKNKEKIEAKAKLWRKTIAGKRSLKSIDLKKHYGITLEQYEKMLLLQNGICLLCKQPFDLLGDFNKNSPVVDHDHNCCNGAKTCGNCIRGIIHSSCNLALGNFNDDSVLLRLAAEYIEKFKV